MVEEHQVVADRLGMEGLEVVAEYRDFIVAGWMQTNGIPETDIEHLGLEDLKSLKLKRAQTSEQLLTDIESRLNDGSNPTQLIQEIHENMFEVPTLSNSGQMLPTRMSA